MNTRAWGLSSGTHVSGFWTAIELKLESAEGNLQQVGRAIRPQLPPHYVAIQSSEAIINNSRWGADISSYVSAFLADCRSVPDIIQSYFGEDPKPDKKWASKLPPSEKQRREEFQRSFRCLYERFSKLPLSRARVDTMHRRGFPEIWVKVRKRCRRLQHLSDSKSERIVARSDPALQWAATLPRQQVLYLPSDFFFKTAGGRYKPLFPECQSYLRRTRELVGNARKLCDKLHKGQTLTKPPRKT